MKGLTMVQTLQWINLIPHSDHCEKLGSSSPSLVALTVGCMAGRQSMDKF